MVMARAGRVVKTISAFHTETVEVKWTLADGTYHYVRVTCPPAETIAATRRKAVDSLGGGPPLPETREPQGPNP